MTTPPYDLCWNTDLVVRKAWQKVVMLALEQDRQAVKHPVSFTETTVNVKKVKVPLDQGDYLPLVDFFCDFKNKRYPCMGGGKEATGAAHLHTSAKLPFSGELRLFVWFKDSSHPSFWAICACISHVIGGKGQGGGSAPAV